MCVCVCGLTRRGWAAKALRPPQRGSTDRVARATATLQKRPTQQQLHTYRRTQ